jgi:SWI/SNF-related matrix-associated actin-dependent regulator 1 of chromatin subfamily A
MILADFQKEGVRRIYEFQGRALLADQMGLGKTIQALEWIRRIPQRRPVIIVCPASVKYNWQSEALDHFNIRVDVIEGRATKRTKCLPGNIVVINYDILPSWLKVIQKAKPQVVVLDESHYLINHLAKRTKAAMKLSKLAASVVALSGTPMTNRPIELWPVLQCVDPTIFPSRQDFAWRFCAPKFTPWGWKYDGATNVKALHRILRERCMIRRLKKDVLKELPNKSRNAVPFKLSAKSYVAYQEAQNDFLNWLGKISPSKARRAKRSQALTKIGYLLRLVAKLKLEWTEKWIADFLDANPKEKLVCFTMHRFVIDRLIERFRGQALFIDGRVKGKKRHDVVRAFQTNRKYRVLFGNWKAAGIGITLHAASNLAALDLPWVPGDVMQGEDRIHRIGQKMKCFIHYLMALGTIEEKQVKVLKKKTKILNAILNGQRPEGDLDFFDELLREIQQTIKV